MPNFRYEVIIPAFNAAETIADAVRSLNQQTVPPERIFIIDDGSTDHTYEVATKLAGSISVIAQVNQGPAAATNAGLERVTAPFISFLDADDVWVPEKAERQRDYLASKPTIAGCFARCAAFTGSVDAPEFQKRADNWGRTTLMMRREVAVHIGMMLTGMPGNMGEVIDWIARGRHLGHRFELIEEVLAWRRIRPGSLSYSISFNEQRGYLLAARRAIERRRNAANSD